MRSTSSNSDSSTIDPIAELLSQLTGVRRGNLSGQHANLNFQNLQAQLSRERESLQSNRTSIFGHPVGMKTQVNTLSNSANKNQSQSGNNAVNQQQQQQAQHQTAVNNLNNLISNQVLDLPGNLFLHPLPPNTRDPRYLLSK
jgi:hypothetical protein